MPIKSYLAHPFEGRKEELIDSVTKIKQCEVVPAENRDVVIVVTETSDKQEEEQVKELLEQISSIKLLAMVSGFNTPKK